MTFTDIITIARSNGEDRAANALAAGIAARHDALLTALCMTPLPPLAPEDSYAIGEAAVHEVMERIDKATAAVIETALAPVRQAAVAAACRVRFDHTFPGEAPAEAALRARASDLVVLGRPSAGDHAGCSLAEAFIRSSGAPCLLAPAATDTAGPFETVVIAWNGSRQAKRAVDDALPFLRAASKVDLVTVGGPAAPPAPDLDALADRLARKGVAAATKTILPPAHENRSDILLRRCAAIGADLLVMGAFSRPPRTEQWFGGMSWSVMTRASLPVLMSR